MMFLTDCLFIGWEAEGPNRGRKTLFVSSHAYLNEQILSVLEKEKVEAVYFGAGSCFDIGVQNIDLVPILIEKGYKVVIEINGLCCNANVFPSMQGLEIVLYSPFHISTIKTVVKDNVEWRCMSDLIVTRLSDFIYEEDRRVL